MTNIRIFSSENFQFLELKFSIYLNRRVYVIGSKTDLFNFWDKYGKELRCRHRVTTQRPLYVSLVFTRL